MNNDTKKILNSAKKLLDVLNDGKLYPNSYVIDRFNKAATKHPSDQLIGNMRDVFEKRASKQGFFSQKEITGVYDRMLGISGGRTAFRAELGDFLKDREMINKQAYSSTDRRGLNDNKVVEMDENQELSNAFAAVFNLGDSSSFGTFNPKNANNVEKVVITKLSSMGCAPSAVHVSKANEHFVLTTAVYNTNDLNKIAIQIPVQITNGMINLPESIIHGGELIDLNKRNLFICMKDEQHNLKSSKVNKFAGQRGSEAINIGAAVLPKALEKYASLENDLIVAASKYTKEQIKMAVNIVDVEFKSANINNPQIKVHSSNNKEIILSASIPTAMGRSSVNVPVEFHNGTPILPSVFITDAGKGEVLSFSASNINNFVKSAKRGDYGIKMARQTGEMSGMTYNQLLDQVLKGVASKDYKLSEDALSTIQSVFGPEQFKTALDHFTKILKASSEKSQQRNELVKQAFLRGDLINLSSSIEPYCPKLGLPLSKVDFDKYGMPTPKGRRERLEAAANDTTVISTSKIILT